MPDGSKQKPQRRAKRRNPMARRLREGPFRARRERNRRKYTRKSKHKRPGDEPEPRP